MPRVLIAEFMDEPSVAALSAQFDTRYDATLVDDRQALLGAVGACEALIVRNRTRVDAGLVAAATRLKVVGRLGVGLDNIDLPACAARGIEVIPATGANALAVAEYVVATAMLLLRGAYLSSQAVAEGKWPRATLSEGQEVGGKVLGLVGFGSIGQLTAKLAAGLGMRVIASDPQLPPASPAWQLAQPQALAQVLALSDVISLHVPLVEQTRNLIDAASLATMKAGAFLINTSRGGIVDEAALAQALREGRLAGAALDVFVEEPLRAASPLAGCPNLILTPHIAGVTRESNARVGTLIAQRVAAFLER